MKKILVIWAFLIFVLPLASSVEFDLKKDFYKGETLLTVVSGNFLEPPLKENIHLYRGHVRVPFEFNFAKINNKYYISGSLLGKIPNNYSLKIEEVRYYDLGKISDKDIIKSFTISNKTADFSINPGFVITTGNFSVEIQNLQDTQISINIESDKEIAGQSSLNLSSGEIKKIYFSPAKLNQSSLKKITFSSEELSYDLPVYILKSINADDCPTDTLCYNSSSENDSLRSFIFEPNAVDLSIPLNLTLFSQEIYLKNTGEENIKNINFYISDSIKDYIKLPFYFIDSLEKSSKARLNLEVIIPEKGTVVEGSIKAEDSSGNETFLFLKLNFTKTNISDSYPYNHSPLINYSYNYSNKTNSSDNNGKTFSKGKIIGWAIIALLVLYLIWFFTKKYRGTVSRKINLKSFASKKPPLGV